MVYDVNLNAITLCTYPMVHISKTFHHTREILPTHVCMYFIHVHVKYRHSFLYVLFLFDGAAIPDS